MRVWIIGSAAVTKVSRLAKFHRRPGGRFAAFVEVARQVSYKNSLVLLAGLDPDFTSSGRPPPAANKPSRSLVSNDLEIIFYLRGMGQIFDGWIWHDFKR